MRRSSRGFTLIELLIVVVIIGILAGLAIPKFANSKQQAYVSAMKSDLHNLATAQHAFFSDSAYFMDASAPNSKYWVPTSAVSIVAAQASNTGWSAKIGYAGSNKQCSFWSGVQGVGSGNEGETLCQ